MPMCGLQKLGFLPKPIVAIVGDYAMSGVLVAQACKLWWWDIDAAMWWLLTEWNFNISTARIIIAYGKTQWKYFASCENEFALARRVLSNLPKPPDQLTHLMHLKTCREKMLVIATDEYGNGYFFNGIMWKFCSVFGIHSQADAIVDDKLYTCGGFAQTKKTGLQTLSLASCVNIVETVMPRCICKKRMCPCSWRCMGYVT